MSVAVRRSVPRRPLPEIDSKIGGGAGRATALLAGGGDGAGERVGRSGWARAEASAQQFRFAVRAADSDPDQFRFAAGQGAGLVEGEAVDFGEVLERDAAAEEDSRGGPRRRCRRGSRRGSRSPVRRASRPPAGSSPGRRRSIRPRRCEEGGDAEDEMPDQEHRQGQARGCRSCSRCRSGR